MEEKLVIENTDGFFFTQIKATVSKLRALLEALETELEEDPSELLERVGEEMEIEELINYWEIVLTDNGEDVG